MTASVTSDINNIPNQGVRDFLANQSMGAAGLAEGTNAHTIKTANILHYRIGGQAYVKAATDNIAMTACAVQANGTTCYYLVTINASGTVKLTKGTDGSTTLPACPTNEAPIGIMKVVATAAFTSGTTDLGGQGTFADINYVPVSNSASGFTYA